MHYRLDYIALSCKDLTESTSYSKKYSAAARPHRGPPKDAKIIRGIRSPDGKLTTLLVQYCNGLKMVRIATMMKKRFTNLIGFIRYLDFPPTGA